VGFLFLPERDDPDSFVREKGKAAFVQALAQAKPLSQFLFGELSSKVDMATEEGRARFLAQAKPLVSQIEAPALRAMLRHRLAELARLDPAEIEALLPPAKAPPSPTRRPLARQGKRAASFAMKLLGLVLWRPDLAHLIPGQAIDGAAPEYAALKAVVAYFGEDVGRNLGQASAYFEGSEHHPVIVEALGEPLLKQAESPDFDYESEIRGAVEMLEQEQRARRGSELLRLIDSGEATAEEQAEFRQFHAQLATAKGNPAPEERSKF